MAGANCELMVGVAWQREPPDSAGHWVWVDIVQGEVLRSGICSFPPTMTWCVLSFLHRPGITRWAKIELPTAEADDSEAPGDSLAALGADYQILVAARGWPHRKRKAFCDALLDIWGERAEAAGWPSQFGILYEPGDYARAAEKAKEVRGGD